MAAAAAAAAAAPAAVHTWEPSEFTFDPYRLTAGKCAAESAKALVTSSADASGKQVKAGGSAPPAAVKKRPGRQKRTSVLCQVPGCGEELVDAKKYYRRYRICQLHCNMAVMVFDGRRQRFCQQCGRFHDIDEFEGAKRSCTRKLKRHNERRRGAAAAVAKEPAWRSDTEGGEEEAAAGGEDSGSDARIACTGFARRASARRKGPASPAPPPLSDQQLVASQSTAGGATLARQVSANGAHSPSPASMLPLASAKASEPKPDPELLQPPVSGSAPHSGSGSMDSSCLAAACAAPRLQGGHLLAPAIGAGAGPAANAAAAVPASRAAPASPAPPARQEIWQTQAQHAAPQPPAQQQMTVQGQQQAQQLQVAQQQSAQQQSGGADGDLETVLRQLLHDEELQQLRIDPVEVFASHNGHGTANNGDASAPPAGQQRETRPALLLPRPTPQLAAPVERQTMWDAEQFGPSLDVVPMDLLEDIPMLALPEDSTPGSRPHGAAGLHVHAPLAVGSGQPGLAAAAVASGSGTASVGDRGGLALPLARLQAIAWEQQRQAAQLSAQQEVAAQEHATLQAQAALLVQRQQQEAMQQATLPPHVLGASHAVLHGTHSMLSVPAGRTAPLVGYALQPDRLTSMALKVFNCTPDQLLPSVRTELEGLLSVGQMLLEGFIRPGCTQLTVNALLGQRRAQELQSTGLRSIVTDLMERCSGSAVMGEDMIVQYEDELAVVKRRRVIALLNTRASPALIPALALPLPLAVHGSAASPAAAPMLLRGRHLCGEADLILARQQGRNLAVELHACGSAQGGDYAKVRLLGLLPGWADLEVQRGSFLSRPRPLLVLPNAAAACEVRGLERDSGGIACLDDLLRDMGLVVQYLCRHELEAQAHPCPAYSPPLLACIAGKARQLVATAAARGWAATTELLLPAVTADGSTPGEALAAMDACCPAGTTLLHVAVGTGSALLASCLLAWSAAVGGGWAVDARGAAGVTPLHVAALLPDAAAMQAALTAVAPATAKLWGLVQADDGTTPEGMVHAVAAAAAASAASASPRKVQPAAAKASTAAAETAAEQASANGGACSSSSGLERAAASDEGASSSKPEATVASSPPRAPPVQAVLEAAAVGAKPAKRDGEGWCGTEGRLSRRAIKAHLSELHMTSIVSEVEDGEAASTARAALSLGDSLGGALVAGLALLRGLRPSAGR